MQRRERGRKRRSGDADRAQPNREKERKAISSSFSLWRGLISAARVADARGSSFKSSACAYHLGVAAFFCSGVRPKEGGKEKTKVVRRESIEVFFFRSLSLRLQSHSSSTTQQREKKNKSEKNTEGRNARSLSLPRPNTEATTADTDTALPRRQRTAFAKRGLTESRNRALQILSTSRSS